MLHSTESSTSPRRNSDSAEGPWTDVNLVPEPRLEWSLATEAHPGTARATAPSAARRSWIHTAPETQVLALYRRLGGRKSKLPAPWWLRALDRGELPSRSAAFDIEDEVHTLLCDRPGWVFVPWADTGETGYWEYGPSDREPVKTPTTVVMTDQHPGWVNVIPAYDDEVPLPIPVNQASGLLAVLPLAESF